MKEDTLIQFPVSAAQPFSIRILERKWIFHQNVIVTVGKVNFYVLLVDADLEWLEEVIQELGESILSDFGKVVAGPLAVDLVVIDLRLSHHVH